MEVLATLALTGEVIIDKIAVGANRVLQSELAAIVAACILWGTIGVLLGSVLS